MERLQTNWRFDDLVRSERYFTATLLPLLLFHDNLKGVERFVGLVEKKATTEHKEPGKREPKGTTEYDFQDVEVITEFHIKRDLKSAHMLPEETNAEPNDEKLAAPDVVIVAGRELVVCEGKFFSDFDAKAQALKDQLHLQRRQVRYLFGKFPNRPHMRAYRHVAIVPFDPKIDIGADVILTWDDIRDLAHELMGRHHYVTVRLRNAVEKYNAKRGVLGTPYFNAKISFDEMREKCQKEGDKIWVGHRGGEVDLRKRNLGYVKNPEKQWKWRDQKTKGHAVERNWLSGTRWLKIIDLKEAKALLYEPT